MTKTTKFIYSKLWENFYTIYLFSKKQNSWNDWKYCSRAVKLQRVQSMHTIRKENMQKIIMTKRIYVTKNIHFGTIKKSSQFQSYFIKCFRKQPF